jgi:uncharacterized protein YqeY
MNLKERITEDMKAAMRARDSQRLGAIRLLQAAIKQKEVDERVTLGDDAVIGVIDKLIKQRHDSIEAFTKAVRQDLADKERAELHMLQAYLPARLPPAQVQAAVQAIAARVAQELGHAPTGADMGKLMAAAKTELAGKADMAAVSQAVKAALAG